MKKSFLPSNKRPFASAAALQWRLSASRKAWISFAYPPREDLLQVTSACASLETRLPDVYYVKHHHRALITRRETIFPVSLRVFPSTIFFCDMHIVKHRWESSDGKNAGDKVKTVGKRTNYRQSGYNALTNVFLSHSDQCVLSNFIF